MYDITKVTGYAFINIVVKAVYAAVHGFGCSVMGVYTLDEHAAYNQAYCMLLAIMGMLAGSSTCYTYTYICVRGCAADTQDNSKCIL